MSPRSIVIVVENLVRVYNIQTGDCTRILETDVSINELIAIQFPDDEDYNLYSCSDNGYVIAWTWEQGAVLRETVNTFLNMCFIMKLTDFFYFTNLLDNFKCLFTETSNSRKHASSNIQFS